MLFQRRRPGRLEAAVLFRHFGIVGVRFAGIAKIVVGRQDSEKEEEAYTLGISAE